MTSPRSPHPFMSSPKQRALLLPEGRLVPQAQGVRFVPHQGPSLFFEGIGLSTRWVKKHTAYQWNGTIHISASWLTDGFSLHHFIHEYGHYLQQRDMGIFAYFFRVALPSMHSVGSPAHSAQSYEQDATRRGEAYVRRQRET